MRKLVLAVTILGLTAATAFTAGGALVGTSTDPVQKPQVHSGGVGHKGAMKGGMKGGMHGKK
jgi:hypothetical protein